MGAAVAIYFGMGHVGMGWGRAESLTPDLKHLLAFEASPSTRTVGLHCVLPSVSSVQKVTVHIDGQACQTIALCCSHPHPSPCIGGLFALEVSLRTFYR